MDGNKIIETRIIIKCILHSPSLAVRRITVNAKVSIELVSVGDICKSSSFHIDDSDPNKNCYYFKAHIVRSKSFSQTITNPRYLFFIN
jgi:hypothetical protein